MRNRIETNQGEDVITSSAINQLEDSNEITPGQYKDQLGMVMREGLLCRGRKVVVPGNMRQDIISLLHREGHPGVDKTTRLVRHQFYWKRMNSDIEQFCRECLICHKNKSKKQPKEKLVPLSVARKPREVVAFDVATLPWAITQHRYFLLLIDAFSKYVELCPMTNQESSTIATAILDGWVHRRGPPDYMLSDQGPNVDGVEIRNVLARYGIKKKRSSPYHPEGDGQSERGIQAVKQIMRCMLQEKEVEKDSWPTLLPQVGYIMNSMPNISTGFTPF